MSQGVPAGPSWADMLEAVEQIAVSVGFVARTIRRLISVRVPYPADAAADAAADALRRAAAEVARQGMAPTHSPDPPR